MTSYQALINKIEAFYNDHLQVKKVGSDFNEQLPNFATKDERYPLVFITPIVASTTMDVNTISLEVYCLDIIQKDRANITVILSDCHQILVDLINYFNFSNDYSFDIVGSPSITPLNNQLLDYAAGWVMNLDVDISNWTNCQVPLKLPVVVGCDTISVTYTLEGEEPVTVEVEKEEDGNYYFDGYEIEKDGEEWFVNSSCEKEVVVNVSSYLGVESTNVAVKVDEYNGESVYLYINQNNTGESAVISTVFFDGTKWIQRSVNGSVNVAESTDFITWTSLLEGYEVISTTVTTQSIECISVNYGETTVELLKVGIFEGQNTYIKGFNPITNGVDYAIYFVDSPFSDGESWHLIFNENLLTPLDGTVYILPKSPFINPPISDNWSFVNGEDLGSVTTTPCDCGELQATLSEDTPCPFGTYTIEEGSPFEAFEVNPIL
jgi:hypothetical protein